jgi:hypothetical protein
MAAFFRNVIRNKVMLFMVLPGAIWFFFFSYLPYDIGIIVIEQKLEVIPAHPFARINTGPESFPVKTISIHGAAWRYLVLFLFISAVGWYCGCLQAISF